MPKRANLIGTVFAFLSASALFWWLAGRHFVLIDDEGIYLDGARRMLAGEVPYRDFFVLTGPGTFWNVGVFFKIFGVSLGAGRALLALDLGLISAALFWLAAELSSLELGIWLTLFFVTVFSGGAGGLVVNHRWDSAAFSMVSVALLHAGLSRGKWWLIAAAGAAAGYAGWITPPLLLVMLPMFAWVFYDKRWKGALWLASGVAAVSIVAAGILIATGSLMPMLRHFAWSASQYSGANKIAYGSIVGGYAALFQDAYGVELWIRAFFVFFVALPAIAPIGAVVTFAVTRRAWNAPLFFVLGCAVASVIACAPRLDVGHLTYGSPLSYVVAGCALSTLLPGRLRMPLVMILSLGGAIFMWNAINQRRHMESAWTREGWMVGQPNDLAFVHGLEQAVAPGESFFVFPYLPIAYFVTKGHNPTRYTHLQPGMMGDSDEESALASLIASPPNKVLYMDVPAALLLRLFPSSDPKHLRMEKIEDWLKANYIRDEAFSQRYPGYDLLRKK